jgi:hypothetical protein
MVTAPADTSAPPTRPPASQVAELLLVAAAGGGGALAGAHPTSTVVVDPLYAALFAAAVTYLSGRAGRPAVLWLGGVALVLSRGWLIAPALAGLVLAFSTTVVRRPPPLVASAAGALSVEVALRWPPVGFHGATALAAAVAVTPVLVHGTLARWHPRVRTVLWVAGGLVFVVLVLAGPLALQALRSRAGLNRAIATTDAALASVHQGDTAGAASRLAVASAEFAMARSRLGAWWTAGADLLPVAAQQRRALVAASAVAADVTGTVGREASAINLASLHYRHATVNLAQVEALKAPLQAVGSRLAQAGNRLDGIRSGWLLAPVRSRLVRLDGQVRRAYESDSLAAEAVSDAPSLLGGDGTRHYLIALCDTAESRGLGGLLVWYGNLTASDGHLTLSSYGDALTIGAELRAMGGGKLTGPADYLARYGRFHPEDYFIDATYSPDLPTVTDVVSQLYSEVGHPPIDGMIVLDPKSLAAVFQFTGPIYVPGFGTVDAANATQLLDVGEYALYPDADQQAARKAALSTLMGDASQRLTAGGGPGVQSLIRTLAPEVRTGDLMFWSVHPQDQPLLERVGLSGQFPSAQGGDLLAVTTQNAGNNKIDAYLHRSIADRVTYASQTGAVSATVTITLRNTAPATGLSYQVIDSYPGSGIPAGANLTWLTLYSPLTAVAANLDGRPVAITPGRELGVNAYSTYVQIPSQQTVVLTIVLSGRIDPAGGYRLTVHRQPMVNPDTMSVEVTTLGSHPVTRVWQPPDDLNAFRFFPSGGQ